MSITVIKSLRLGLLGVAALLMLPLPSYAAGDGVGLQFDKNKDGIIDKYDWRYMSDDQRKTYARLSLEALGENPGAFVTKDKTREQLLLEGLSAIYRK